MNYKNNINLINSQNYILGQKEKITTMSSYFSQLKLNNFLNLLNKINNIFLDGKIYFLLPFIFFILFLNFLSLNAGITSFIISFIFVIYYYNLLIIKFNKNCNKRKKINNFKEYIYNNNGNLLNYTIKTILLFPIISILLYYLINFLNIFNIETSNLLIIIIPFILLIYIFAVISNLLNILLIPFLIIYYFIIYIIYKLSFILFKRLKNYKIIKTIINKNYFNKKINTINNNISIYNEKYHITKL